MHGAEHLLEIFYLLLAAQVMAFIFKRLNQPVVIGEVLAGVLVGPALLGLVHEGEILEFLAELGAVFLLFMVGLETRLKDILAVGKEAFLVAVLGVALPFLGGYLYGLEIGFETLPALFLGTALVATSVGITARVLQELGVLSRPYSRIILGAAVIDDVLGLIVLAVVNGVAETGQVEVGAITRLIVLSVVFVGLAVFLSTLIARLPLERLPVGSPLGFALALGVGMAALAASIGLAPIVGAFLGGMLLSEVREKYRLEEPIFAIESFLAPIFFAMVGVRLELSALASPLVEALVRAGKAAWARGEVRYALWRRPKDWPALVPLLYRLGAYREGIRAAWPTALAYPRAYREWVEGYAGKEGLDPDLLFALLHVESRFDPKAVSPTGALGLAQFLRSTWADVARMLGEPPADPFDPESAIRYAARYLRWLMERCAAFSGVERLACAVTAYNGGIGYTLRGIAREGGLYAFLRFQERDEPREYLAKVLSAYAAYKAIP